jgi:hypothetical protein
MTFSGVGENVGELFWLGLRPLPPLLRLRLLRGDVPGLRTGVQLGGVINILPEQEE